MTKDERFVILASSLGTVFEWYDFYLYGSLAGIIGAQFFSAYPPATRDIFALLAFAAGFLVRPFGAIVLAEPPPMWPSIRRRASAATTPRSSRPRRRSGCSCP
jgi:hypothetical protein